MSEYASMAPPEEPKSEFERWVYDTTKKNNSLLTQIATSLCNVAPPPPPPLPREPTPQPLPAPVHTGKEEQASSSTLLLHGKIKDSGLIDLGSSKIHSGSFTLLSFSTEQDASKALDALDLMSEQQRPLPFSFKPATISELSPDQLRNCNYISPPNPLPFFWDFENCPIPHDYGDVKELYTKMERFLGSQNFEMTQPKGFGARETISRENWPYLEDKFGLEHVEGSKDKEVADFMIKRYLLLHLIDEPQPCPSLVFTGDQDFEPVFKFLQDRGYDIYLGYNSEAPAELKSVVKKAWHYHDIIEYVEPTREERKIQKRKMKNKKRKRNTAEYKENKQQKGLAKLRLKREQEAQRLRLLDELEAKGSSTKHGENKEVDPETPSQKKQIKEDSGSRRQLKGSQKQEKSSPTNHGENEEVEVEDPEMPSQEKQIKGNSKSQLKRPQNKEKSSLTKQGENKDATQKSGKKRPKKRPRTKD